MHKTFLCLACMLILLVPTALGTTLKAMYDQAPARYGYDRYIELQTGVTYTGGLFIGATFNRITSEFEWEEVSVRIKGNGAILDLEGGRICISYCNSRLDIDDCVVLNGDIRFRGYTDSTYDERPAGSVKQVTFYKAHDYGVRIWSCGENISLEKNLAVDTVCTGDDCHFFSGISSDWLPTGASFVFALDNFPGAGNGPDPRDNWSYFSDSAVNADPLRHYLMLCDYG